MKFSIKDFFKKCDQIRIFPAAMVTFTEEILNGKLHFFCAVIGLRDIPILSFSTENNFRYLFDWIMIEALFHWKVCSLFFSNDHLTLSQKHLIVNCWKYRCNTSLPFIQIVYTN